jgi:transposase
MSGGWLPWWRRCARCVAANLPEEARKDQVRVLRLVPAEPGREAQVDYGQLGRWTDPATGRRHVVNAFAMVLCCSRMLFVRAVLVMDQRAWTECHVAAFAFFGGVPARLVPDNLKTGVDRPDLYDPKVNRSYAELAAHYGCLVDPARSRKPCDKAQVKRPMPYIRDSFWRGREFTSIEHMQACTEDWSAEVAGRRSCRPLHGACECRKWCHVMRPANTRRGGRRAGLGAEPGRWRLGWAESGVLQAGPAAARGVGGGGCSGRCIR